MKNDNITIHILLKICQALDCNIEEILEIIQNHNDEE